MALPSSIVRRRKMRAGPARKVRAGAQIGLLLLVLLFTGVVIIGAFLFEELTHGLPSVTEMETRFGSGENLAFQPLRIFDRERKVVLFEASHPAVEGSRWLHISEGASTLPGYVVQATLAAVDDTFWENPGYLPRQFIPDLLRGGREGETASKTITQRLVESQLLPVANNMHLPLSASFRSSLLAVELNRRYAKSQILEWYLNSADYGRMVYGVDAGALAYFGKHAEELTLAESAMLAGFLTDTTSDPLEDTSRALQAQRHVLERMLGLGMITTEQARQARWERVDRSLAELPPFEVPSFAGLVLERMDGVLPNSVLGRSGVRVISTLDYDLQLQAECTARNHLQRLAGGPVGTFEPAADGSACIAAGLLPPLRPQDSGFDHNLSSAALVVLDPKNGEILSAVGSIQKANTPGSALFPLIYLSAFATGYAPGTMLLDLPAESDAGENLSEYQGPVRMRTALANAYLAASQRTTRLVGTERIVRTARSMGLGVFEQSNSLTQEQLSTGDVDVGLLDLAAAYAVLADEGRMVGAKLSGGQGVSSPSTQEPAVIKYVEDASGSYLYKGEIEVRAVLSRELAYLVTDVLSDEPARWPAYGPTNLLEIGRPTAVMVGKTGDNQDNWTVGYTPSRVVGVWVGNTSSEEMVGVQDLNGAAPIWHAVIRYATRNLPSEAWPLPGGVVEMEVCDPSGLLPTEYCPVVVNEVFLQGTEPTHFDNLFRPFLVNRETGKLATLATPIDLVEERVYMVPPPEAIPWAHQSQIDQPPDEYDTIYDRAAQDPAVRIASPQSFEVLQGDVRVSGVAGGEGFDYYRLQYGQGLNPSSWVQIGADVTEPRSEGQLGRWDTEGLNGLYTLQLVVVRESGQVSTNEVFVTLDNQPPSLELLTPRDGQEITLTPAGEWIIEVRASDSTAVAQVQISVDGGLLATLTTPPYAYHWTPEGTGEFEIEVSAVDQAGNRATTQPVTIQVVR